MRLPASLCLPCMLFVNVYNIESFDTIRWDIVGYALAVSLLLFVR